MKFLEEYYKLIKQNQLQLIETRELFRKIISNKNNTEYSHLPENFSISEYSKMIFENNGKRKIITESSLSRIWNHIEKRTPFAMLSWQRAGMNEKSVENPNPKKTKLAAFQLLKEDLRKRGYGFIELLGGYVERGEGDAPPVDVVDELSVCVPNISLDEALEIGQFDLGFGSQDSILYSDGETISLYNTNPKLGKIGEVTMNFDYGKGKDALPMAKDAIEYYFSVLKKGSHRGKKFGFITPEQKKERENLSETHIFKLLEMRERKTPRKKSYGWWANFGMRIV